MNEEKEARRNAALKRISIALAILCAAAIFSMYFSIMKMKQEISSLTQQVNSLQSSIGSTVSSAVSGISGSIEESLKKSNSIISDYSYRIEPEKFNLTDKTMPISVTVTPKEFKAGVTATFLVETEAGKRITAQAESTENGSYIASLPLPLEDYFKLSVVLDDGTIKKSEKLEDLYRPFSGYLLELNSNMEEYQVRKKDSSSGGKYKLEWSGRTATNITIGSSSGKSGMRNFAVKGELKILKNGKIIETIPIKIEKNKDVDSSQLIDSTYYTDFQTTINCRTNDLIVAAVTVEDNNGLKYTQIIDQEKVDNMGDMNSTGIPGEVKVE